MALTKKQYDQLHEKWTLYPQVFIQTCIIDPYNKAENSNVKMTTQQLQGIEDIRRLVTARLKKAQGVQLNDEEVELNKKIGISIMAGKGLGKDALAAWIIIWFLRCFPDCKIPCISVSADQLNKVLWSEIGTWLKYSILRDDFELQNDKFYYNQKDVKLRGKTWFAFTKAANPKSSDKEQVETLSGVHARNMLIVVDEGSGIPDPVFDPLEGTLTQPCNWCFMIFNPTRSKGYAIDSQYKYSDYWVTQRWSAEESEIADRQVIERTKEKYGIDSTPYRVRILGLPPLVDESTLIPMDWILDAVDREIVPFEKDPVIKGMDCGAGGDQSIICTRKGGKVFPLKRLTTPDSQVLINWAGDDLVSVPDSIIRVDNIGVGWAVCGTLQDRYGARVESADSRRSTNLTNPDKFVNKRAEMYWTLREKFEKGFISIPNDPELIDELSAMKVLYNKGKIQIVEKLKIKAELGHSPDSADALALSYYNDNDVIYTGKYKTGVYYRSGNTKSIAEGWLGA